MSAILRAATERDAALLAQLHRECFEEKWDEASLHSVLTHPATSAFIAGDAAANDLQAFIAIQTFADEAEILTLGTAPTARRKGLAKSLLFHAAAHAAEYGARTIFLEVAETNAAAAALYAGAGFAIVGRRKSYYRGEAGQGIDALRLSAALPLAAGRVIVR